MASNSQEQWIGRSESITDSIGQTPAKALAATLNRKQTLTQSSPLPPLWHWLYFLETATQDQLAEDGHRERGGFLPPVSLPRRMWAGSQLQFHVPIKIGEQLTRESTIESITEKQGRGGRLTFVTVRHEIKNLETLCITETQDIVYRDIVAGDSSLPPGKTPEHSSDFEASQHADSRLLFRYSALTFNAHRIHYDHPYATQVEGYPGLLVHGPLLATLMLELLWKHHSEALVTGFEFKALRPVFDLHNFSVHGTHPDSAGLSRLWVSDHDGFLCMQGEARIQA